MLGPVLHGQKSQAAAPKTPAMASTATQSREIPELDRGEGGGVAGRIFFPLMLAQ